VGICPRASAWFCIVDDMARMVADCLNVFRGSRGKRESFGRGRKGGLQRHCVVLSTINATNSVNIGA
jgi:hypothetical protein